MLYKYICFIFLDTNRHVSTDITYSNYTVAVTRDYFENNTITFEANIQSIWSNEKVYACKLWKLFPTILMNGNGPRTAIYPKNHSFTVRLPHSLVIFLRPNWRTLLISLVSNYCYSLFAGLLDDSSGALKVDTANCIFVQHPFPIRAAVYLSTFQILASFPPCSRVVVHFPWNFTPTSEKRFRA